MPDFGVVPEGFRAKTLEDILGELRDEQRATVSTRINTSPAAPTGQVNATFARQAAQAWDALKATYDSRDPDKAEGDALEAECKLCGTTKRAATKTEVSCRIDLDNGETLLNGVHFAAILNTDPPLRFTPKDDYTSAADGEHVVTFEAEFEGPTRVNANTLTVIDNGPSGWNSVTNDLDGTIGRNADDDVTLRVRRNEELARAGSTTARAIKADLDALEVDGVKPIQQVSVVENDTDVDGFNGLPRHTIECVIDDSPLVDNDVLAQTIWDSKAGGIGTAGSAFGTAVDAAGANKRVYFSRPVLRPTYLAYTLVTGPGYIGDDQFKAEVVATLTDEHGQGTDVFQWITELAGRLGGVLDLDCNLGFAAAPTEEDNLSIAARERATFDTSRVTVVSNDAA